MHFSPAASDRERSSTAETTPIGTPRGFGAALPRKADKEKENWFAWHHKHSAFGGTSYVDSTLLDSDFEDTPFPLFNDPAPFLDMGSRITPIDIASSSRAASPRSAQTSNLTSALQSTSGNEARPTTAMDMSGTPFKGFGGFGGATPGSQHGGAQPISMNVSNREKPRRESLAGSMVTGMSWGGNSVGSWIRDDIIMQGTSPFAYQSPSFHSSSYLPKLEANFMRDFSCCGLTLPSLHELLQHYEENHTDQVQPSMQKQIQTGSDVRADPKAAIAATTVDAVRNRGRAQQQQHHHHHHQAEPSQTGQATPQRSSTPVTPRQTQPSAQVTRGFAPVQPKIDQDDDAMGDMEMEDDYSNLQQTHYPAQTQARITQRSQFGQPASGRVPNLDINTMNMGNPLQQHQGLRNSQPTTPVSAGRNGTIYYNNPTVSSVNTPTLTTYPSAHPLQQQYYTPDSSAPGSPGELDGDFLGNMGNMNVGNMPYMQSQNQGYTGYDFSNDNGMGDYCIDEPAKRLFSLNGGFNQPQQPAQPTSATQLGDGQYSENSELAKTIREQQKLAGVPDPSADGGVPKPFHCPVIGCEKAYKNQNGLKYHKSHGHNTQQLKDNNNGTFSIVDPETLDPYPGTLGMEKHKPYRCDTCGKRYKNLNGLKYHKNHSPNCDSEIQNPYPHSAGRTDMSEMSTNEMVL